MAAVADPPDRGGGHQGGLAGGKGNSNEVLSYAKVTGKQGRKKLNVLDIMLERRDSKISYNLNKNELSKLLFTKMKLDPKNILKLDTSGFGKILVELTSNINPENLVGLPAFDIRDGLRTKYYKPHHRNETLVTVSWMDIETPDELVLHVFNHFGNVKSNVKWTKIKEEEGESEMAKLLNNILSGQRQFWMEIVTPLPSYAMIDKRKVKIHHAGQRRTCARCQKVADLCRGNSNAKLCEDNGGEKVNAADAWRDTLDTVEYKEWSGGEVDSKEEDENEKDDENVDAEGGANISNCDGVIISNLEEDTTTEDIKFIMKGTLPKESMEKITVHPTDSTRSKLIKDMDLTLVSKIAKHVDKKSYKGRLLHCRPHVPVTPPKKTTEPNEPLDKKKEITDEAQDPEENDVKVTPTAKDTNVQKDDNNARSHIPGLLQKDIDEAMMKKMKQNKKNQPKENKKETEKKETEKKVNKKKENEKKENEKKMRRKKLRRKKMRRKKTRRKKTRGKKLRKMKKMRVS